MCIVIHVYVCRYTTIHNNINFSKWNVDVDICVVGTQQNKNRFICMNKAHFWRGILVLLLKFFSLITSGDSIGLSSKLRAAFLLKKKNLSGAFPYIMKFFLNAIRSELNYPD